MTAEESPDPELESAHEAGFEDGYEQGAADFEAVRSVACREMDALSGARAALGTTYSGHESSVNAIEAVDEAIARIANRMGREDGAK